MKPGDELGCWCLVDLLGKGGNGEVWLCVAPDGALAAIKVLLQQRNPERLGLSSVLGRLRCRRLTSAVTVAQLDVQTLAPHRAQLVGELAFGHLVGRKW
jgi:hypothetical protein